MVKSCASRESLLGNCLYLDDKSGDVVGAKLQAVVNGEESVNKAERV